MVANIPLILIILGIAVGILWNGPLGIVCFLIGIVLLLWPYMGSERRPPR